VLRALAGPAPRRQHNGQQRKRQAKAARCAMPQQQAGSIQQRPSGGDADAAVE